MNKFDNISDEQLACFIEDNLCEADCDCILDTVACDSDMDVLSIAYNASKLVDTNEGDKPKEIVGLPRWNNRKAGVMLPASILPMSHRARRRAFLSDDDSEVAAICACEAMPDDTLPQGEFNDDDDL